MLLQDQDVTSVNTPILCGVCPSSLTGAVLLCKARDRDVSCNLILQCRGSKKKDETL